MPMADVMYQKPEGRSRKRPPQPYLMIREKRRLGRKKPHHQFQRASKVLDAPEPISNRKQRRLEHTAHSLAPLVVELDETVTHGAEIGDVAVGAEQAIPQ